MLKTRLFALATGVCCLGCLFGTAKADSVFDTGETPIAGICITSLPETAPGTLMLGSRILRPGDVLTAQQAEQVSFCPASERDGGEVEVGYLPVFADSVAEEAVVTIGIRGKENKAPVAEDSALETYKNLPNSARLKVSDPEGETITYTVTRQPRRGTVTIGEDGTYTYSPKKNKVGVDSFTFTAADAAGNVSREATVTVTILKPTDSAQYTDTLGRDCRFTAEWMRNSGIFTGEKLAGQICFYPDRAVSRGEFVAVLVKALEIPTEEDLVYTGYTDEIPKWLQPYLAAAVRAGVTAGLPDAEVFGSDETITGAEASVMLQNALDLSTQGASQREDIPAWAASALTALEQSGMPLEPDAVMTRDVTSQILYQASKLAAVKKQ